MEKNKTYYSLKTNVEIDSSKESSAIVKKDVKGEFEWLTADQYVTGLSLVIQRIKAEVEKKYPSHAYVITINHLIQVENIHAKD